MLCSRRSAGGVPRTYVIEQLRPPGHFYSAPVNGNESQIGTGHGSEIRLPGHEFENLRLFVGRGHAPPLGKRAECGH